MATTEEKIIVTLEAEIRSLTTDLNKAERRLRNFERKANRSIKSFNASAKGMNTAFKLVAGALTLNKLKNFSDSFTQINSRLRLVTASSEEFARAQESVFNIAQETRQEFGSTAELYQRLSQSTEELGLKQDELLSITQTVNKAIAVSGASSQAASAAIIQLGQGLAAGALRGQEFNSVVEQTPRLAKALSDGLGVNIGQLRELSKQGALTSDVVVKALQSQADAIEKDFSQVGATIDGAFTTLENVFIKIVGGAGDASGASQGVAESIMDFADTLNDPRIAQGAESIFVGVVKAFEAATIAVTETTNAVKFFADELAARVGGPAADDIIRLEDAAKRLKNELRTFDELAASPFRFFIKMPDRDELQKELDRVQADIKAYYDQLNSTEVTPVDPSKVGGRAGSFTGILAEQKKPKSTGVVLPEETNKKYERLLQQLQQQKALENQIGEAAKVRAKIQVGALGELTKAQEELLIQTAEEIDKQTMLADLTEEVSDLKTESLTKEQRAVEELQAQYKTLAEAVQAGVLSGEEASKIAAGLAQNFQDVADSAEDKTSEISEFAAQAARSMQSAFADFLFNPFEDGIKGMGEQFAKIIQRMIAEAAAAQALNALLGANFTQTGQLGGIVGNFAGGFASGGTIPPNSFAVVGEDGPELAYTGSLPTTVMPNVQMKGGMGTNISINVQGVKDSGDLKRTAKQIARQTSRAITEAG